MSTNSIHSDRTFAAVSPAVAPLPENHRRKWNALLWLALPLTLAVGCATSANRSAADYDATTDPVPVKAPVAGHRTANQIVGDEIHAMLMADQSNTYTLWTSVKDGVVTLRGPQAGAEQDRMIERIRELPGVTQVLDERGNDGRTPGWTRVVENPQ